MPPRSPKGSVRSKPAFEPVFAPRSDGSSGMARRPLAMTRSRSAWKRVASAQSTCSSEKTSTSGSITKKFLTCTGVANTAPIALRASPAMLCRTAARTLKAPPLEGVLRVRRHAQVIRLALDHRQRRAAQCRQQSELVPRQSHGGRDVIHRMRTDDKGNRQALAATHGRAIDRLEVGRRVQVHARL